jgi:tRNA-dependent cyclodipeptide synthase
MSLATLPRESARDVTPPPDSLGYLHRGPAGVEASFSFNERLAHPNTRSTADYFRSPHTVLLGFSVGNGYFTRRRVEIAVRGCAQHTAELALLVPDAISVHTYRALGYTEPQSQARWKKHRLHMSNRVRHAMKLAEMMGEPANMRLLSWAGHVSSLAALPSAMARVENLMLTNEVFRADVMDTARLVLEGKRDGEHTESSIREASNYLLSELAFISICSQYFDSPVLIPYYKHFEVGIKFCAGAYDAPVENVSWAVYNIDLHDLDVVHDVVHGGWEDE